MYSACPPSWVPAAMPTISYTRRTPEQSVLFKAFSAHWPSLRAAARAGNDGAGLPDFIENAAKRYQQCGRLQFGFVHAKCARCKQAVAVAFSCKQRGLCSSCDGKRMTEEAAHLVDQVIPPVPVRQWVVTFPHDLRFLLAWNKKGIARRRKTHIHGKTLRLSRNALLNEAALGGSRALCRDCVCRWSRGRLSLTASMVPRGICARTPSVIVRWDWV